MGVRGRRARASGTGSTLVLVLVILGQGVHGWDSPVIPRQENRIHFCRRRSFRHGVGIERQMAAAEYGRYVHGHAFYLRRYAVEKLCGLAGTL